MSRSPSRDKHFLKQKRGRSSEPEELEFNSKYNHVKSESSPNKASEINDNEDAFYSKGLKLEKEFKLKEAVKCFNKISPQCEHFTDANYKSANYYYENRKFEKSLESINKILAKDEKNSKALLLQHKIFIKLNNLEKAKEVFECLKELKSSNKGACFLHYDFLVKQEDKSEALDFLNFMSELFFNDKRFSAALKELVLKYCQLKQSKRGLKLLNKISSTGKENLDLYYAAVYLSKYKESESRGRIPSSLKKFFQDYEILPRPKRSLSQSQIISSSLIKKELTNISKSEIKESNSYLANDEKKVREEYNNSKKKEWSFGNYKDESFDIKNKREDSYLNEDENTDTFKLFTNAGVENNIGECTILLEGKLINSSQTSIAGDSNPNEIVNDFNSRTTIDQFKTKFYKRECERVSGDFYYYKEIANSNVEDIPKLKQDLVTIKRLKHGKLVNYHECESTSNCLKIKMDYLEKPATLKSLLQGESNLSYKDKINILTQSAWAIQYLHSENLTFGNLSAENILIIKNNDNYEARLINYVIRPYTDYSQLVHYCAPEVLRTNEFSYNSDVYAFAMIMWEVFTCESLSDKFKCTLPQMVSKILEEDWHPDINTLNSKSNDKELSSLIINAWSRDINKRPSMKELANKITSISRNPK